MDSNLCTKCGAAWNGETGKYPCAGGGQCDIPAARKENRVDMSSKARKLAKRIELTQQQASGTKHGCDECRSLDFRQQMARQLVERGLVRSPTTLACPACSAAWVVQFRGDVAGGEATVSFTVPVLS